jgi:hypothetical protein
MLIERVAPFSISIASTFLTSKAFENEPPLTQNPFTSPTSLIVIVFPLLFVNSLVKTR